MGKAERYTTEDIIAALQYTHGLQYLAAKHLGCSRDTIHNYIVRYPEIAYAYSACRGEMVDMAESKLWDALQSGEQWAVCLVLRTLGKDRGYVERHENTGKDGTPQLVVVEHRYGNGGRPRGLLPAGRTEHTDA